MRGLSKILVILWLAGFVGGNASAGEVPGVTGKETGISASAGSMTVKVASLEECIQLEPNQKEEWLAWEKRLREQIAQRFRFFAKSAFRHSPELQALTSFHVTGSHHIVQLRMEMKSSNVLFNVLAYQAVKSLNGDPCIAFPEGSKVLAVSEECFFDTDDAKFGAPLKIADLAVYLKEHPDVSQLYLRDYGGVIPEQLPEGIKELMADRWDAAALPRLPRLLDRLRVTNCNRLKELPALPSWLREIVIDNCDAIEALPELPNWTTDLTVSSCSALRVLPKLPDSLIHLRISNCAKLSDVPTLPATLQTLEIADCNSLKAIPTFPKALTSIDIHGCSNAPNSTIFKMPPQNTCGFGRRPFQLHMEY